MLGTTWNASLRLCILILSLSLLSSRLIFLSLALSTGFRLLDEAAVPTEFGTDRYWLEVADTFCRRRELLVVYVVVSSLTCTHFKMKSESWNIRQYKKVKLCALGPYLHVYTLIMETGSIGSTGKLVKKKVKLSL
jgi:hypothetical protein